MRAGLVCLLGLLLASPAMARDFEEAGRVSDAQALCEKIAAAREAKALPELRAAMARIPDLHNELRTKTAMARLRKSLDGVLGDEALPITLRLQGLGIAARLHDDKGVWKLLSAHLPAARDETAGQMGLAAIDHLHKVAPADAIKPLQELVRKAKDPQVAVRSIKALGGFRHAKKRTKVLKFLLDHAKRIKPGRSSKNGGRGSGAEARERYRREERPLIDALNELTGQRHAGIDVWLSEAEANKRDLDALFRFQR